MAADDELSRKLAKRNLINEGEAQPQLNKKIPISAEFKEFSINLVTPNLVETNNIPTSTMVPLAKIG